MAIKMKFFHFDFSICAANSTYLLTGAESVGIPCFSPPPPCRDSAIATHDTSIMVAMLATKADYDKALADAGSKLVTSLVRRLAPALGSSAGSQPLAWP